MGLEAVEMKQLTVRNVPHDLEAALDAERRRRGASLNRTVVELLRQALGLAEGVEPRENGLRRFAGTWTEEEYREFEKAIAPFEAIDEELWR